MDMLLLIFLISAIVYTRYNKFKVKMESEEIYRFYKTELEEIKRTVIEEELLNK